MDVVPGNYWDLGLVEGSVSLAYWIVDADGRQQRTRLDLPIPGEIMDELEALIGDGNASITVGKEIKASEDFKTAGSTAWLKLTCNQDLTSILKARELATMLVVAFAEQGFQQAQYTMDRLCGKEVEPPPPLEIEVVAEEETDPDPRTEAKPKGKKTSRGPDFRR